MTLHEEAASLGISPTKPVSHQLEYDDYSESGKCTVRDLVTKLHNLLSQYPNQDGEVSCVRGWDGDFEGFDVTFQEPKTDLELQAEVQVKRNSLKAQQDRERAEYERLKAKFDPKP